MISDNLSEDDYVVERYEVTAALVAGGAEPRSYEQDCARPYSERPKVTLVTDGSTSLADVLAEATAEFAQSLPRDYRAAGQSLDFYRGDPGESVVPVLPTTTTVTITAPKGLAIWRVPPQEATMDDIVLAASRKVFLGDPLRPYLLVDPSWEMGGLSPWGWDNFIGIWDELLRMYGSWQLLKSMVRLRAPAAEYLERAAARWQRNRDAAAFTRQLFEDRGADIMDVIESARAAETYRIADIMAWTGFQDPAVAADIAGWAGYVLQADSETFAIETDELLLQLARDFVIHSSMGEWDLTSDGGREAFAESLAEFLIELGLGDPPV